MNRMERVFQKMQEKNERILVAYFPLCDPILDDQVVWAGKYFANGTTVLEMGLPFENPMLDGAVVRRSMERTLKQHTVADAFEVIASFREAYPDNILQIMTYFEIADYMGIDTFADACAQAGVDAVLSPNTPLERVADLDAALEGLDIINLRFVPYHLTETVERDLIEHARGYIFQQAVDGATGPQKMVSPQIGINVRRLKDLGITTPVIAGFGISNASQIKEVCSMGADGVIVGSSILRALEDGMGEEFIKSLRNAL